MATVLTFLYFLIDIIVAFPTPDPNVWFIFQGLRLGFWIYWFVYLRCKESPKTLPQNKTMILKTLTSLLKNLVASRRSIENVNAIWIVHVHTSPIISILEILCNCYYIDFDSPSPIWLVSYWVTKNKHVLSFNTTKFWRK